MAKESPTSNAARVGAIEAALAQAYQSRTEPFTPARAKAIIEGAGGAGPYPAAYKAATGRELVSRNGWPVYQHDDGRCYSTDPQKPGPLKASETAF